jgi:hypothetical protein
MTRHAAPLPPDSASTELLFMNLLFRMLRNPRKLLLLWNWKSALLSVVLRGPIFFVAAAHLGWKAALAALFAELIFCALSAGFYGAVVQTMKDAAPQWLTGLFLSVVMPVIFQILEYLLHWFRGTPHLRAAAIMSLVVASFSALFNWYAMLRGTLLVGGHGSGFGRDLYRLPLLFLTFLAVLPRRVFRAAKTYFSKVDSGMVGTDLLDEQ